MERVTPPAPAPAAPRWWQWLSSPSLTQHATRYAGLVVGVNVIAGVLIGLAGGDVLDRRLPIVLFPLGGFVIWAALAFYRRRRDTEMGFGQGLKLGTLVAVGSSVVIALLLGLVMLSSPALRQRHRTATLRMLGTQRTYLETLPNGKAEYARQVAGAATPSALDLAVDELPRRLVPALVVALLGAILFRKANPAGTEPERAPRPPKQPRPADS